MSSKNHRFYLAIWVWWMLISASVLTPTMGVDASSLAQREFQLKHRAPDHVALRVQPLLSESGRVQIVPSRSLLVIRDDPGHIERIAAAVNKLDVPLRNIELVVKLLEGSRDQTQSASPTTELPEVIQKMREFLKYDRYRVIDSAYIRALELQPVMVRMKPYRLRFTGEWLVEPADIIRLVDLTLERLIPQSASEKKPDVSPQNVFAPLLTTTLNLRTGEPTVVGTASSEESESILLLVLQARLLEEGGT